MVVSELIEILQKLDPDLRVFVEGYESGFDDIKISDETNFSLYINEDWYYGPHEKDKNGTIKGIVLERARNKFNNQ